MRSRRALFLVLLQACGGSTPTAATPAEDEAVQPAPVAEASGPPSYEVHEWGLIDVAPGGATEVAAGPGRPAPAMTVRKPVLYVRLDEGVDTIRFGARVEIPGGSIVEHWPAGQVSGAVLEWPEIEARVCAPAAEREPVRDTRMLGRACDTPDGYCEVDDLPGYVADGSACLRVAGAEATLLFYRGALSSVTLPYRVSRSPSGEVVVEATRALPAPVGDLWRVRHMPGAGTAVARVTPPTSGAATLGEPEVTGAEGARARLAADLETLGLTTAEGDAFLRAWTEALFGPSNEATARRAARVTEEVLYWLPREDADRIAPLTLTPAPRALRRAILVRVAI